MLSEYTFLSDHSYSLRPDGIDNDELPLNQRGEKKNKRRQSTTRTSRSFAGKAVSIDRNSSDKENNSLALLTATRTSPPLANGSKKNKSTARSSARATMSPARAASGKSQDSKTSTKTGVKPTAASITKKKKPAQRGKGKSVHTSTNSLADVPLSLSIEERVKLRRTKPLTAPVETKPVKVTKSRASKPVVKPKSTASAKQSKSRTAASPKATKLFLGSGLDLDNIVLGNRQRRSVQS